MDKLKVAVVGAGGKMGTRTSNNLAKVADYTLYLVESGEKGLKSVRDRGFTAYEAKDIISQVDVVVLAVPDTFIKVISEGIVALMSPGAGLLILDPAAAVAKELALRDDCTFGVVHPCHPSYFLDQDTYEARHDYFGGLGGKQDIVMAKIQGDDERFSQMRQVAEKMFAPVEHSYVMEARNIAFLEPTLVELLGATCLYAMAETVKEAEKRGIQKEAAVSFLSGHIYNLSANFLGFLGNTPVSDACKVAISLGDKLVLRDDWKKIWDEDVLDKVIATMLHPENPKI
ncbi:phosphogluconate dehydrogenase C-terminal domain-containing protein [uncultured Sphaerochaeta sp.]|uniref:phosphogluconate dehydrogenase C-terminal domain-containing protein n=1 Tax=uncultured Sphaerochaeta sp. TaxID=886478 RepID=UPI002A0A8826|nr:phosphogluconate dehydrogenase C-terminal domain-containing protein [uncultured Sphaerochaeta sp.]